MTTTILSLAEAYRNQYGLDCDDFVSLGEARANWHDAIHEVFGLCPTQKDEVTVTLLEEWLSNGGRLRKRLKALVEAADPTMIKLLQDNAC